MRMTIWGAVAAFLLALQAFAEENAPLAYAWRQSLDARRHKAGVTQSISPPTSRSRAPLPLSRCRSGKRGEGLYTAWSTYERTLARRRLRPLVLDSRGVDDRQSRRAAKPRALTNAPAASGRR